MKLDIIKGVKGLKGSMQIYPTRTTGVVKVQSGMGFPKKKRITSIEWEHAEGRSAGKAAVGAIAGTLVAGPIGLIAGAALGGKKNEESTAVVTFEDEGSVIVKMKAKDYEDLSSWVGI